MNWVKTMEYIFMFALACAVVYNTVKSTNKTIIGAGGRQVIISTDTPKQSLFTFGCSNAIVEGYWKKNRTLPTFNQPEVNK